MRWVHRFPTLPPVDAQKRWTVTRWGIFDLGWAVDGVRLVALPGRWALLGFWHDEEPEMDLLDDEVEFDTADEAIIWALRAGLPVWDEPGNVLLVEPLPWPAAQAVWLQQVRQAHLTERVSTVDALIEQHPHCFQLRATRETLVQRWRRVAGPQPKIARRERSTPSSEGSLTRPEGGDGNPS